MTGNELRELRTALHLAPKTLAEGAGISRSYLVMMETQEDGQAPVPDAHLERLLDALEFLGIGSEESVIIGRQKVRDLKRQRELAATGATS